MKEPRELIEGMSKEEFDGLVKTMRNDSRAILTSRANELYLLIAEHKDIFGVDMTEKVVESIEGRITT